MARKHRVEVRLNSKEHQILGKYADKFGMTHSEAVRRLIHQLVEDSECFRQNKSGSVTIP